MLNHAKQLTGIAEPGTVNEFDMEKIWSKLSRAAEGKTQSSPKEARADVIVEALRMGLPSEVVYWQLRQFAQANRENPTITTSNQRYLYVACEPHSGEVCLYIGDRCGLAVALGDGDRRFYAIAVQERYVYKFVEALNTVMRVPATKEIMVREIQPPGSTYVEGKFAPVLVYSVCEPGEGRSRACLTLGGSRQPQNLNGETGRPGS